MVSTTLATAMVAFGSDMSVLAELITSRQKLVVTLASDQQPSLVLQIKVHFIRASYVRIFKVRIA